MRKPVAFVPIAPCSSLATANGQSSMQPTPGMVPTEEAAVAIAIAAFNAIFGPERIREQAPFHASLRSGIWCVSGTLPNGALGGTAEAEISQNDGRVIRVFHSR